MSDLEKRYSPLCRDDDWSFNVIAPKLLGDGKAIAAGMTALVFSGATTHTPYTLTVLSDDSRWGTLLLKGTVNRIYEPHIDYNYEVELFTPCKQLLMPTMERAFVDAIKYDLVAVDEDAFLQGLEFYVSVKGASRLYEAAAHLGVPKERIEYWVNESIKYSQEV